MKKSIILGMLAASLLSMGLTSCGDDEYTDSKVTYFVDLALKGEPTVSTPLNSNYVDAGFTATINGQDASDHVVTTSNVNTAELGPYSVVYTATNDDGYSSTVTRKVYVGDYTLVPLLLDHIVLTLKEPLHHIADMKFLLLLMVTETIG